MNWKKRLRKMFKNVKITPEYVLIDNKFSVMKDELNNTYIIDRIDINNVNDYVYLIVKNIKNIKTAIKILNFLSD